jgi:D-serine deaminase-like pyridoxal phosphate-dependent protein
MRVPEMRNLDEVASPALLILEDQVRANIAGAIEIAGGAERLRPHVKTHKSPDVLRLQREAGIEKFKCATIAEAEMAARAGVRDILLALQPVGPNGRRLLALVQRYGETRFSTIGDDVVALKELSAIFGGAGEVIEVM